MITSLIFFFYKQTVIQSTTFSTLIMSYEKKLQLSLRREVDAFLDHVANVVGIERWRLYVLFPSFTYYIEQEACIKAGKCIAIVRVGSEDRQCSRKHKFGLYCGLHNNFLQKNTTIKNVVDVHRVKQTCLTTPYANPKSVWQQYFSSTRGR